MSDTMSTEGIKCSPAIFLYSKVAGLAQRGGSGDPAVSGVPPFGSAQDQNAAAERRLSLINAKFNHLG